MFGFKRSLPSHKNRKRSVNQTRKEKRGAEKRREEREEKRREEQRREEKRREEKRREEKRREEKRRGENNHNKKQAIMEDKEDTTPFSTEEIRKNISPDAGSQT